MGTRIKKQKKRLGYLRDGIAMAVEECYRKQKWPSAARIASLLLRRHHKLNGRENRLRKSLLRKEYGL